MTTPIVQSGTIQQFSFTTNELAALLWQHSQASNIQALVQAKQNWYDQNQTSFWENFESGIFDLQTANNFGLAVWAIILDAPIVYTTITGGNPAWGFGQYRLNFTNGNFSGTGGTVVNYPLSTETARVILQLRYFMLTGACTAPYINRALQYIFAENYGTAYIADGYDMTQAYIFGFVPPSDMQYAFNNEDVLPRPAGVGSSWRVFIEAPWGFNSDAQNFNNGNFSSE